MSDTKCFRGWIAFLILQSLGATFSSLSDQNKSLFLRPSDAFGKRAFGVFMLLASVNRFFLLKDFDNMDMHWLNIFTSVGITIYYLLEMFYFEYFLQTPATTLCCTLNGLTFFIFIFYVLYWKKREIVQEKENLKEKRKGGRLFARHYMEANVLKTPDTPETQELRRRVYH